MKATLLHKCENETGEAATWMSERAELLWSDIENGVLHRYLPKTKNCIEYRLPSMLSAIVPIRGNRDEVLLALQDKLVCFNLEDGSHRCLKEFGPTYANLRPNDVKASPEGRLWLGMMHLSNHQETGSLLQFESDLSMHKVLKNQSIPNGIVWNKTGNKMYYADSGRGCIEEYVYDASTGMIRFSHVAIEVPAAYGVPDGMAIDSRGFLWVAHWGGYGVYVWDPIKGNLINKIDVPVPHVASCAFGGEYNRQLYITTARAGLNAHELELYPLSGSLFCADLEVSGVNHYSFVLD